MLWVTSKAQCVIINLFTYCIIMLTQIMSDIRKGKKKSLAAQGLPIYVITDKQGSQSKLHIT